MANNREVVFVNVAGVDYAFEEVSVAANATSPERTFNVSGPRESSGIPFAAPSFKPATPCTVKANGDLVVTGWIETVDIEIDANHHSVTITGKSIGNNLVRNSVKHDTHEWRDEDALGVANSMGTGVPFTTDETLTKFPVVRANPGGNALTHLDKLVRKDGMYLCGQPDGSVKITKHGKERNAGAIIEGLNLLRGRASFSDEERFAEYEQRGHLPTGTGEQKIRHSEKATDSGARPGTYKSFNPRTSTDRKSAKNTAELAASRRYGESVKFEAELQGWRDGAGVLWIPGALVFVVAPSCDLEMELAIESVNWSQDATSGSKSSLSLVHPSALGGGGGGKSGAPSSQGQTGGGAMGGR